MRRAPLIAAAVAVLSLGGCISLLPKATPADLYRFQANVPVQAGSGAGQRVDVTLGAVQFTQASAGDRILTVDGSEAAYIAGARWVAPADALFEESLLRAFDSATVARVTQKREAPASNLTMDVSVDAFEAQYRSGMKAAPTVVVELDARMIRYPDRVVVGEKRFHAEAPASDNRVTAIVPAYDAALTQALKDLVAWTDQEAAQRPPAS